MGARGRKAPQGPRVREGRRGVKELKEMEFRVVRALPAQGLKAVKARTVPKAILAQPVCRRHRGLKVSKELPGFRVPRGPWEIKERQLPRELRGSLAVKDNKEFCL